MAKKTSKSSKPKSVWGWVKTSEPGKPANAEKEKATALFEPYVQHLNDSLPPLEEPQQFNQAVRVESKWRGSYFYLMSHYKCPPGPEYTMEGFEMGIARLAYKSPGAFDLAYFRHTGQWHTVYYDLPLEDCLERVKSDPFFEV